MLGADIFGRGLRRADRLDGSDLLGWHRELTCPSCASIFVLGIDDEGQTGQASARTAASAGLDDATSIECGGDRVLVEKFLYEFRRPRRWEVAVFHFPGEPSQAYVKRVVGLPGESIRIADGDVFVNGRIVRKSLAEIRAMRILVHDSRFPTAKTPAGFPRWLFRRGDAFRRSSKRLETRQSEPIRPRCSPMPPSRPVDDWLVYKHWDPATRTCTARSAISTATTARAARCNEIKDLGMEARIGVSDSVETMSLARSFGLRSVSCCDPGRPRPGRSSVTRNQRAVSLLELL